MTCCIHPVKCLQNDVMWYIIRGTSEVFTHMNTRGIHFSDAFSSVFGCCFEMLSRVFATSFAHVQPFIQHT